MNRRDAAKLLVASAVGNSAWPAFAKPSANQSMPKLSFMLWALEKQNSFDRCLDIVTAAGYQGVELVGEFQRWQPAETRRILARLRSLGLVIDSMSGVKAGFAVPDQSGEFLGGFAKHLQAAQELGCPQVILLSGRAVKELSPDSQRGTAISNLARAADLAARAQVEIVIEPIDPLENPGIFLQSVTAGFEIVRAVNRPNVKVLYDFYHEQRGFGNLIEKLEKNVERVGLVHIADVPGRHEPGTGEIDFGMIYRKLAELNYQRWIAMEYYPTTDPVMSLRASRVMAQEAFRAQGLPEKRDE